MLRKQSLKSTAYASIQSAGYRSGDFDIYALPEYYDEFFSVVSDIDIIR